MLEVALLPLSPTVEPAVLALNNAHAAELSWLDGDRLTFLLRQAFHARRIGEATASCWPSTTDLIDCAGRTGHDMVVCEVNRDPPNPASDAFHAAQGFTEMGQAAIHQGSKTVRYLARAIER